MKRTAVSLALTLVLASGVAWSAPANINDLLAKAEQGDVTAMLDTGRYYLTQKDTARGILYLEHVIRSGGANAAYAHTALGQHYESMSNSALAMEAMIAHYRSAAVAGDVVAQTRLGRFYLKRALRADAKPGEKQQFAAQAELLLAHAAAAGNDPEAAYALGNALLNGDAYARDVTRAEMLLARAAERNHVEALHALGNSELARGDVAGRSRLEKAAKVGHGASMLALAKAYETGLGVTANLEEAGRWADKAVAANVTGAQDVQGRIAQTRNARLMAARATQPDPYANRYGNAPMAPMPVATTFTPSGDPNVDRIARENAELRAQLMQITQTLSRMQGMDTAAAVPVSYGAAPSSQVYGQALAADPAPVSYQDAGDPNQQGLDAHARGNYREAYRLFSKAAKRGNADAMNNQAMLLLQGQGVEMNAVEAMTLFRAAAERGHVTAVRNIAYMYERGVGVSQDLARSRVWYQQYAAISQRVQRAANIAGL